jgi:SAM-dependent methyltransferase
MAADSPNYSYFDEAYFQDGSQRGTAFRQYLQNVVQAPWYREVAEHVCSIFKPKRVLELGCATGVIVKYLAELGCDAHGVDVSEWAVANRLHPNVTLHPAEALPFADASFDVVYSSGTLEHLPSTIRAKALHEIGRVCKPNGYQFHMLPIVGVGPYRGDRAAVLEGLRHDKTHFSLFEHAEWMAMFEPTGWKDTGLRCAYAHDTETMENSWCNIILYKAALDPEVVKAITENNIRVADELYRRERQTVNRSFHFSKGELAALNSTASPVRFDGVWNDLVGAFPGPQDLSDSLFRANVCVSASEPIYLRWSFLGQPGPGEAETTHVLETWRQFPPGHTLIHFRRSELAVLSGSPDMRRIVKVCFGGNPPKAEVRASLVAIRGSEERQILP